MDKDDAKDAVPGVEKVEAETEGADVPAKETDTHVEAEKDAEMGMEGTKGTVAMATVAIVDAGADGEQGSKEGEGRKLVEAEAESGEKASE